MDKSKIWFLVIFVGAAIIGFVGVVMVGISETEARGIRVFDCKNVNGTCTDTCERTFSCGRANYILTGCYRGDPEVCHPYTCCHRPNARKFLEDKGYCRSWYPWGYSENDFTKGIGFGNPCRFQVQIRNDWITLNQGPEPNSQPIGFCNGNIFLTPNSLRGLCNIGAVKFWHDGNATVPGC